MSCGLSLSDWVGIANLVAAVGAIAVAVAALVVARNTLRVRTRTQNPSQREEITRGGICSDDERAADRSRHCFLGVASGVQAFAIRSVSPVCIAAEHLRHSVTSESNSCAGLPFIESRTYSMAHTTSSCLLR